MKVQHFPNFDRISTLAVVTLLAYAMGRFVDLPTRTVGIEVWGVYFGFVLDANTVVSILVAGLTASGADWLIRQHPALHDRQTLQHWFVPALTALVLGEILHSLPTGLLWNIVFVIGAGLLLLVLVAEYLVVNAEDPSYPAAVAGLTALSFALFLVLAITLKSNATRLSFLMPPMAFSAGLISLRYIYLRLNLQDNFTPENGRMALFAAFVISLIVGQLSVAFHYWTLSPIPFGLALLGPAYGLTNFVGNLTDGRETRRAIIEPALIWGGIWLVAVLAS
ncbi:MAG: hypothetical protein H6636_11795 [Anaerolineales bacterium]|nr:hypothetical protein [Anaerolineales bacterium]